MAAVTEVRAFVGELLSLLGVEGDPGEKFPIKSEFNTAAQSMIVTLEVRNNSGGPAVVRVSLKQERTDLLFEEEQAETRVEIGRSHTFRFSCVLVHDQLDTLALTWHVLAASDAGDQIASFEHPVDVKGVLIPEFRPVEGRKARVPMSRVERMLVAPVTDKKVYSVANVAFHLRNVMLGLDWRCDTGIWRWRRSQFTGYDGTRWYRMRVRIYPRDGEIQVRFELFGDLDALPGLVRFSEYIFNRTITELRNSTGENSVIRRLKVLRLVLAILASGLSIAGVSMIRLLEVL